MKPFLILVLIGSAAWAADQPQPATSKAAAGTPIAQQQQAAAAMAASLAAQRAAIARQVGQKPSDSFFLLSSPFDDGPPVAPIAPLPAVSSNKPPDAQCDPLAAVDLDPLIADAATREHLQPELLRGVVQQESGFRPCAVSPKGAMGLMQLMPGTANQLGVKNPFDPKENVDAGARFLKQLLDIYNDLPTALGAYNAGPGRVNEAGGIPAIPETLNYIQRIMSLLPKP